MEDDINVIEMYANGEIDIRYTQLDGLTLPVLFFPPGTFRDNRASVSPSE